MASGSFVRWYRELGREHVGIVGGKNASLGELVRNLSRAGIRVPGGFAMTAEAYWEFLDHNVLRDRVAKQIERLHRGADLADVGRAIRGLFAGAEMPARVARDVADAYRAMGAAGDAGGEGKGDTDVAVRSSATAEDLPEASFAGQQETYLHVRGEDDLLTACRRCFASLFTDRAINYREELGFDHLRVALSVGVQPMVRSDLGSAGVMFFVDTESGFPRAVLVNASWGLGEAVVGGQVDPDEYVVFKPLLQDTQWCPVVSKTRGRKQRKIVYAASGGGTRTVDTTEDERSRYVLDEADILMLARWATAIEDHYGVAMDMEWAKDGRTGEVFVVQARPETVQARREASLLRSYRLRGHGERLVSGLAVGDAIIAGQVRVLRSTAEIDRFTDGSVLVTEVTDPDWEPVMKRAAAIVTDHGGADLARRDRQSGAGGARGGGHRERDRPARGVGTAPGVTRQGRAGGLRQVRVRRPAATTLSAAADDRYAAPCSVRPATPATLPSPSAPRR